MSQFTFTSLSLSPPVAISKRETFHKWGKNFSRSIILISSSSTISQNKSNYIEAQSTEELERYLISGLFKMSPVFLTLTVAKPVITESNNGCQMKDMDIIFPLMAYGLLQVKWFGFHSLLKSSNFLKFSKMLKMGISSGTEILSFWTLFFKPLPIKVRLRY